MGLTCIVSKKGTQKLSTVKKYFAGEKVLKGLKCIKVDLRQYVAKKLHPFSQEKHRKHKDLYLADPGKARGCSTNTSVTD